jgi:hypothetical protein
MKWFIVTIVYRIICGAGKHAPQFDEQMRLIHAPSTADALQKAKAIGEDEQETFFNDQQQLLQWKFVNVSAIISLHNFVDGAEVFSQIKEVTSADAYTRFIDEKAMMLLEPQLF